MLPAVLLHRCLQDGQFESLVLADSAWASEERTRRILQASTAGWVDPIFVSESELGPALARGRIAQPCLVVFRELFAVERAVARGLRIAELTLGHIPAAPDRQRYLPSVHLGPDELATISRLRQRGVSVFIQPRPIDDRWELDPQQLAGPPCRRAHDVESSAMRSG